MKIKAIALGATIALTALLASAADPVYSVNVVGYHKTAIPPGFSMIANQVDSTNNTVASLIPAPPNGSIIYRFNGVGFDANNYFGGWTTPGMSLAPGEGVFFFNPLASALTNIFAGEVLTGSITNTLPGGFSLVSSQLPQGGQLDSALNFPAANGDIIYLFNNQTGLYDQHSFFGGWSPSAPVAAVGQSFFVFKSGSGANWVRNFDPNTP